MGMSCTATQGHRRWSPTTVVARSVMSPVLVSAHEHSRTYTRAHGCTRMMLAPSSSRPSTYIACACTRPETSTYTQVVAPQHAVARATARSAARPSYNHAPVSTTSAKLHPLGPSLACLHAWPSCRTNLANHSHNAAKSAVTPHAHVTSTPHWHLH
jgi:hypothetical protein